MSTIYVLAGVNGSGKSSIGGETFRALGGDYYNPAEAATALRKFSQSLSVFESNALAWQRGRELLEQAIASRLDFAMETTLGASTIPGLLKNAAQAGIEVKIWYAGLESPEAHIACVQSRVKRGGHDIPAASIRRRYEHSRLNLIELLPVLTALRVYDNSVESDPTMGKTPRPKLVLHMEHGRILNLGDLSMSPEWAKPIVAAALGGIRSGRG